MLALARRFVLVLLGSLIIASPWRVAAEALDGSTGTIPASAVEVAARALIAAANHIRPASVPGAPLPVDFIVARGNFEASWLNAGLEVRRSTDQSLLGRALAETIRSYRLQEDANPERPNAMRWADEMIAYFREAADRRALADAMLEKAAIFLELSQLNHADPAYFRRISRDGDRLLQDCYALAEDGQKVEVLRFWSRFYYNLARPASGRLSERWDDGFLALADQKIDGALVIQPEALRNLNQKARVTQRRARNTLDAPYQDWANRLWDIHRRFLAAWRVAEGAVTRPENRISPLNVLAVLTLDVVVYQLAVLDDAGRRTEAGRLTAEIDNVALPLQLEAWALVRNTNLSRSYEFDTTYDLARLHAIRAVLSGLANTGRQNEELDAAARALADAREVATVRQLDATNESLANDPVFTWLPEYARQRMKRILNGT